LYKTVYIYIYIYIHTHTHTHTYVCVCVLQCHEWKRTPLISTGMTLPLTEFEPRMLQSVV